MTRPQSDLPLNLSEQLSDKVLSLRGIMSTPRYQSEWPTPETYPTTWLNESKLWVNGAISLMGPSVSIWQISGQGWRAIMLSSPVGLKLSSSFVKNTSRQFFFFCEFAACICLVLCNCMHTVVTTRRQFHINSQDEVQYYFSVIKI